MRNVLSARIGDLPVDRTVVTGSSPVPDAVGPGIGQREGLVRSQGRLTITSSMNWSLSRQMPLTPTEIRVHRSCSMPKIACSAAGA